MLGYGSGRIPTKDPTRPAAQPRPMAQPAQQPFTPPQAPTLNAPVAQDLLPGLTAPDDFRAIVNAHFRFAPPPHLLPENGAPSMLGVIGGTAEWIFTFHDRISVTISAADAIMDEERESLAARIWAAVIT